ncbi:hypothetical protein ACNJYD_37010 [Bradyrhizobium sp. DASA03005]|uniref:hypothetical protein n=1 Tax=Bradyrhizobium TaxID=374 RepID=UPI00155ECFFE|nr:MULTISPECIES: hypothetical protein [Bradyrhizobium]MBR1167719.1 hypothetical protein [Bradyrhizobium liaoningense]MDD1519481.1 hypothetical protein [Bradyrhizobium sp. WBAH30]MDD1543725.1 hypothetical protein [Bradyrhizobium sp. WBAH41]MDD1557990.1 hypothetical protein [Bradyrhizobium sp. WBAH23]MDD1565402.1 hypothetical protein [Bradyrhizobium sp. WBAH33]
MRKLILIAAMSLLASQAHAGGSRSLSLAAANPNQPATEQPAATPPQATQASPANVQTPAAPAATTPTAAAPAQSTTTPAAKTTETPKPKRRQPSVEARVIRELHRHGIYW